MNKESTMPQQLSIQYGVEEVADIKYIKLGELFTKTASVNPAKHPDEEFELYSIPSYDNGTPDILKGSEIGSSKKSIKENDVLLSRIVPHIRRCWVVSESNDVRKIGSSEWIVFRSDKVIPYYLRYFLLSDSFHNKFIQTISGVGGSLMRARPSEVAKLKIPLPPLPTQRKIAEVLDRADALRQRQRQIIAHYDQLAQSVFLDMFGDPVTNPKGWDKTNVSSIGTVSSGSTPSRKNESYYSGEIPWVKTGEVKGEVIEDTEEKISVEALENSSCKLYEKGSIIIAMYGQGKTRGQVGKLGIRATTNQACGVIASLREDKMNSDFLFRLLNYSYKDIRNLGRGGNQPNLNAGMIKSYSVITPPLDLQNQFATIIQRIETLKQRQQEELAKSEELFQSLLQRAFRGELFIQEKKMQQMDMF